jgi:hypothetical protein
MSIAEIQTELKKMSNSERLFVIEIATKLVRGTIGEQPKLSLEEKRKKLKSSAESMLSEYVNNQDLTEFNVLDSEVFLDA